MVGFFRVWEEETEGGRDNEFVEGGAGVGCVVVECIGCEGEGGPQGYGFCSGETCCGLRGGRRGRD